MKYFLIQVWRKLVEDISAIGRVTGESNDFGLEASIQQALYGLCSRDMGDWYSFSSVPRLRPNQLASGNSSQRVVKA